MVFDVEQHHADKMIVLEIFYVKENEHRQKHPDQDFGSFRMPISEIGKLAGLENQQTTRITLDLAEEGFVKWNRTLSGGGSVLLTKEGRGAIEKHLYEKSALGKRRKIVGAVKEKSAAGAVSILKEAGKWLGGIVIGAAGASYGSVVTKWVKEMLGIK
jgi:DNA-binding MarR family transcriptional regulator